jgi:hypothetical protein
MEGIIMAKKDKTDKEKEEEETKKRGKPVKIPVDFDKAIEGLVPPEKSKEETKKDK